MRQIYTLKFKKQIFLSGSTIFYQFNIIIMKYLNIVQFVS